MLFNTRQRGLAPSAENPRLSDAIFAVNRALQIKTEAETLTTFYINVQTVTTQ